MTDFPSLPHLSQGLHYLHPSPWFSFAQIPLMTFSFLVWPLSPLCPDWPAKPSLPSPLFSFIVRAALSLARVQQFLCSVFSSSLSRADTSWVLNRHPWPGLLGSVSPLKQVPEEAGMQTQEGSAPGHSAGCSIGPQADISIHRC